MTLKEIKDRIRDLVQEYGKEWLSESMLNGLVNDSINHITSKHYLLRKVEKGNLDNSHTLSLPSDFYSPLKLSINGVEYRHTNYTEKDSMRGYTNYYYFMDGSIYLPSNMSGNYELYYAYFNNSLNNDNDKLPRIFKGYERVIAYYCASEIMGMDNNIEVQAFFHNIYRSSEESLVKSTLLTLHGKLSFKPYRYKWR